MANLPDKIEMEITYGDGFVQKFTFTDSREVCAIYNEVYNHLSEPEEKQQVPEVANEETNQGGNE